MWRNEINKTVSRKTSSRKKGECETSCAEGTDLLRIMVSNLFTDLFRIFTQGAEGCDSDCEFVQEDAQTPPIGSLRLALPREILRCFVLDRRMTFRHVIRMQTEENIMGDSLSCDVETDFLSHPDHIRPHHKMMDMNSQETSPNQCEGAESGRKKKHTQGKTHLRTQIPEHEVSLVQMAQSCDHPRCPEPHHVLLEATVFGEGCEKSVSFLERWSVDGPDTVTVPSVMDLLHDVTVIQTGHVLEELSRLLVEGCVFGLAHVVQKVMHHTALQAVPAAIHYSCRSFTLSSWIGGGGDDILRKNRVK